MTEQEAIDAGWKPRVQYSPKSVLGGSHTMWESPDGSYQLFCLPYRDQTPSRSESELKGI